MWEWAAACLDYTGGRPAGRRAPRRLRVATMIQTEGTIMTIDRLNDALSLTATAALIAAAGLLAGPNTAAAQTPTAGGADKLGPWEACLDGAEPTSQNAPPADPGLIQKIRNGTYTPRFGQTIVDIDPHSGMASPVP